MAVLVLVVTSFLQAGPYILSMIGLIFTQISGQGPKISKRVVFIIYSLFLVLVMYNIITRFQEFSGEFMEVSLMIALAYIWMLQPTEDRQKVLVPMIIVVCCIRFIALCESANEWDFRQKYKIKDTTLMQFAPFPILFLVENKMNRRFGLEFMHTVMSHSLTLMVLVYFYL